MPSEADEGARGGTQVDVASNRWAAVYDELRSHQSLASVINDPSRKGIFRGQWDGVGDFWDSVRESVEELNDQREAEAKASFEATLGRIDVLVGPVPEAAEFQAYLDSFSQIWEAYSRNHKPKARKATGPGRKDGADDEAASGAHHGVPPEYFQSDFKLEHHQIFKQSLQASVERQEELNHELTGHLDAIEVSLFEHIRRAQRDRLFDSLAKLGEPIQADLSATNSVVASLRGQLRSVQRKQLNCGRAVGRLARRKQRVAEVLQRLDCLAHVRQSQPSIQMLLQGQDYVTALDLLESTTSAMDTSLKGLVSTKPGSARLAKLGSSFDHVVEADFVHHSTEAILATGSGATDASAQQKKDGAEPELRGAERLRRLCWCLARRGMLKATVSSTLRDILLSQVKKVLKTQVRALLDEQAQAESGSREKPAPSEAATPSASEDQEDGGGNVGETPASGSRQGDAFAAAGISTVLCTMSFERFVLVWKRMMQDCYDIAKRFCDFAQLIHGAAVSLEGDNEEDADSTSRSAATKPEVDVSNELLRLLEVLLNSLLQKIGALLQARQGVNTSLEVSEWQSYLNFTFGALDKVKGLQDTCRQLLGPREPYIGADVRAGVRAILHSQTKSIIEEFHQKRMAQMQCVLEQERWDRTDVPGEYKRILEELMGQKQSAKAVTDPYEHQGVDRHLHVEGVPFIVVPAVLTLVQLLNAYTRLCRDFDSLAAEIITRMATLLRLFNQKTHQLVLQGQAVTKETLKKITASNLALCSQCCGLVAQILPGAQANLLGIVEGQSGPGSATLAPSASLAPARQVVVALVGDFSKIATEYSEHRNALFNKLSDLLRERYDVHSKKWLSSLHAEMQNGACWEGEVTSQDVEANRHEALEGLVKDVTNMYRALLKNLTGESVRKIFAKAFEDIAVKFEQRLGQELPAPTPPYDDRVGHSLGDRLAVDIAFLREQLEKLSGISTPLRSLLFELLQHLRAKLNSEEAAKALHPAALEVLQRSGRLPQ